ncbi:MAG: hypothetical protein ACRC2M_10095, partial [Planktothrix sp.]
MWATKTSKSEQLDNPQIRIVSNHSEEDLINALTSGGIFASIDPAQKNYAMRFEKRPATKHRKKAITATVFIKESIAKIAEANNVFITVALSSFLSNYDFKDVKMVLVERQLPENYKSTWLAHHTYTW